MERRGEGVPNDYYPPSPIYDPAYKEKPLPQCYPKEKQILDPHYFPKTYEPNQRENAPTLADNLIPQPVMITSEEDQVEDQKEKNDGGDTMEEEGRKQDKAQVDDSGQEADEDNSSDYSDSGFIY